jgi:predicted secreted Zn-dependent protease
VKRLTLLAAFPLLALSGCNKDDKRAGDAPGYAEAAFAPYPGTSVRFYDVDGTDEKSIRASLNALGPQSRTEARRYDAVTNWYATWHWPSDADGKCDLEHLEYSFEITVTLPHLNDEDRVSPALRKAWARYMAALIDHESGHAKHAFEHKGDIENAVKSSSCDRANAAGAAAIEEMGRFDAQYDAETHHGATQGATFPAR